MLFFMTEMMCRFEVGWHPETEAAWAYPTTTAHSGKGYYIKLKKSVLEIFQKGGHKAAFRGSAVYRSDMVSHIENTLNTDIFNQLLQVNKMDIYPVTMSSTHTWTADHDSLTGYQCILLLDTDQPSFIHFNQIHNNNSKYDNVPSYNVSMIWSKDRLDKLKTRLKLTSDAVVINRSIDTVNLGASLYRRMLYSDS
ncbi:hypothetical protein BDB01DRAFT_724186 [Pilobolus umbonatus]|nr:hypothetical protein BDB01DRAFT_724186 [Pilobolus umbonatus]